MKLTDLERVGQKITIPEKMKIAEAITTLQRIEKYEEETTEIREIFSGFVWDAALAVNKAMSKMFGWVSAEPTPGFFGDQPPKLVSVPVGLGENILVPIGRFKLPGVTGYIDTGVTRGEGGRASFYMVATVKRKHEEQIQSIFKLAKELVATESVYRGKAFKLRFNNDDGEQNVMAMPKFLNLNKVKPEELVFSKEVNDAIETSLFTPIEHSEECRAYKVPLKRGALLYGPYGTGKTLAAFVTAKKCVDHAWTFLYCERADELADMVKLAHEYQPAVIFCEDIDRAMSGERSVKMDDILNIIDGIESKGVELMVILTTNHVETINKALLRPGRLDAVINVLPPDAEAAERLLRIYGRGLIPVNTDLSKVGQVLAGTIPAVIRECAERAKLSQLKLGVEGKKMLITQEALLDAANGMRDQLNLLNDKPAEKSPAERLGGVLQEVIKGSHNGLVEDIEKIRKSVC